MVKSKVIMIIVIIGLFIGLGLTTKEVYKLKHKNEILISNLNELNTKNSELIFDTKQLSNYIKAKDTKHKIEVDSILKLLKIKPKNLIRYERILVSNLDSNTTVASLEQPIFKNDSVSRVDWESVRKCLKIKGYVESLDPNPKVVITNTESSNVVYVVKSYKKSFWDNIFFRKGKEVTQITSDCGDIKLDEIKIDR